MKEQEILSILLYFIVYSFLGWLLESIYKTILEKRPVNSGFMHGPFCPIYGIGAIIMYLTLSNYKANIFLVFVIGFVGLTLWEYLVGIALEKVFHTKYWDYSENRLNFQGRICLKNSFFWGILAICFIYLVHPFIQDKVQMLSQNILIYLNILFYTYILVDSTISIIRATHIEIKLGRLKELGETLKEKIAHLEELKQTEGKQNSLESLQKLIEDLKLKQFNLRNRLYKYTSRLKRAFPTMRSEKITEFLSQKIEEIKKQTKGE